MHEYEHRAPYRGGCRLPLSNEDWQFKNPIASGVITTEDESFAGKVEGEPMKINSLPEDKLLMLIAEEYNAGTAVAEIMRRFEVSQRKLYDVYLRKAKERGLIKKLRGRGKPVGKSHPWKKQPFVMPKKTTPEPVMEGRPVIDRFSELVKQAEEQLDKAKRIQQIATALHEEFGQDAESMLEQLYNQVAG